MRNLRIVPILILAACAPNNAIRTNFGPSPGTTTSSSFCPTNFVRIPSLGEYATEDFCIAKYEMKIVGQANGDQAYNAAFVAETRADGTPWVQLTRAQARTECQAMGTNYDLMTNGDWMAVARNIEAVAWNWSGATIGSAGGLSRSVGMAAGVAASVDNDSCVNTGNTCDLSTWNARRRVHQLSNGEYIWDIGGNVAEWMRDDTNLYTASVEISQMTDSARKAFYGPAGNYAALNAEPYGGLGSGNNNNSQSAIARGGAWGAGVVGTYNGGIFAFTTMVPPTFPDSSIGFRCVYKPLPATRTTHGVMPRYIEPLTPTTADGADYDIGMQFTSSAGGTITAIRFYRGSANPAGYTVTLWSAGGVALATGTGSDGTIPGWQEIALTTPVTIVAGSTYTASYYTSNGLYSSHTNGFASDYVGLGNLTTPTNGGVFRAGGGFPTNTFGNGNYYVDVVYAP